jgi:UDP-glucose 4-epimerase
MNNSTVLVTGGAGFIGSELTRQLAEQYKEVHVVDNLVNGRRENIEELLDKNVFIHTDDIRDNQRMIELLNGVDIVFHLACLGVRHSIHSPMESHEVNATATLELLKASRDIGVKRFVYVSSSEVYGTAKWAPMTEDHPTFPMTVYGGAKLAGESYTRAFSRTYNYPTVVVRPYNSYGPRCHHEGDSGEVIPKFLLRSLAGEPMYIFGDGSQTRDFTYVSDTAAGILLAGTSERALGETINLGQGSEITIKQLADEITDLCGNDNARVEYVEERPGDVLRLFADSSKAQELLGFSPQVGLREGLEKLKTWYAEQPQTPEQLLESESVRNWEVES